MHASSHAANPFGLLIDPAAVLRAVEGSQRLESLDRRVCRPLDRTVTPKGDSDGQAAFDAQVDARAETSFGE